MQHIAMQSTASSVTYIPYPSIHVIEFLQMTGDQDGYEVYLPESQPHPIKIGSPIQLRRRNYPSRNLHITGFAGAYGGQVFLHLSDGLRINVPVEYIDNTLHHDLTSWRCYLFYHQIQTHLSHLFFSIKQITC